MRAALAQTASIAILVFAVSSMTSVGLAYRVRRIVRPLRDPRAVFRALVANFVLVPLLAVGIERLIPMDPAMSLGLFLVAGAAGAPFLIKLTSAARRDLALSAALLLLLVPMTVVFLPFYVPLAMKHPSLASLSYVPSSVVEIGVPLLVTMVLPVLVGLAIRAALRGRVAPLVRIGGRLATISLVVVILATFLANLSGLATVVTSGAVGAAALLIVGAYATGYLFGRREDSGVLGLATAQRNIGGAMVVASQDFGDPRILVMVTATSLVGLAMLFPIAWILGRRAPNVGPPTPEARR